MSAAFAAASELLSGAADAAFGESLLIEPQAGSAYASGTDPDRAAVTVTGFIALGTQAQEFVSGDREDRRFHGEIATGDIAASVDRAAFATVGWTPHQGDKVTALDRAGQPAFLLLADPTPDGFARLAMRLVRT